MMMEEIKAKLSHYKVTDHGLEILCGGVFNVDVQWYSPLTEAQLFQVFWSFDLVRIWSIVRVVGPLVPTLHVVKITPSCSKSSCKPGVPGTNPRLAGTNKSQLITMSPRYVRPTLGPGKDLPSWIKRPTTSFAHHHVPW